MYNSFYGFREAPFHITPDPRFLFFSTSHREAFHHVLFGIKERKGFVQLTGEVGAGKTTVCRAVMEELPPTFQTALILNPALTREQLLHTIVKELGMKPGKRDKAGCLELLNAFVLEQAEKGNDVVVFIDEAQDLTPELLEEVRLLSNLETDQRKLLQIVLIGQPELRDKLNDPALRQLRQRITVRYHLRPLSRPDVERYVSHRLKVAGADGNNGDLHPAFTPWALWRVHRYARGIPRLVNAVCDKALLYGFVNQTSQLTGRSVRRAIHELEGRA
jgi:general secretion pathway protein A